MRKKTECAFPLIPLKWLGAILGGMLILSPGLATAIPIQLDNAPEFTSTSVTAATEDAVYSYKATVTDADNDEITLTAPTLPEWLTLSTGASDSYSEYMTGLTRSVRGTAYDEATGDVYYGTESSVIYKITPDGTASPFGSCSGSSFGSMTIVGRTLYAAMYSSGLHAFNLDDTSGSATSTIISATSSMGTILKDGYLYACSYGFSKVVKIDLSDPEYSETDYVTGVSGVFGGCFDNDGNLYVATYHGNSIYKVTPDGAAAPVLTGVSLPSDIKMVSDGSFYISTISSGVLHYDSTLTTLLGTYASGAGSFWGGMTLTAGGTLIFGDNNTQILSLETAVQLTGTPLNEHVGDHPVVLRAVANGVTNEQAFTITVANSNDVPTIASTTAQTMAEDTSLTLTLDMIEASDVDVGDTLHLVVGAGEIYTVDGTTLSPAANWHGTLSVPVYASDGMVNSAAATLTVTVTNVVDPSTVTLGSLEQLYDGTARAATATTDPAELMVEFTYNGSETEPVEVGSYTVIGTVNDSVYTGSATGTLVVVSPVEINLQGNGVDIASGDASPALEDGTDFGELAAAGSASVVHTFTIQNSGPNALSLSGEPTVAVSGAHAADFAVSTQPASTSVESEGSATFEVTFNPTLVGTRTAILSIASDDPDENPYTFTVQGTGTDSAPEFTSPPVTNATEDAVYSYKATVTDADNDAITLSAPTLPSWLSFSEGGGSDYSIYATDLPIPPASMGYDEQTGDLYFGYYNSSDIYKLTAAGVVSKFGTCPGGRAYGSIAISGRTLYKAMYSGAVYKFDLDDAGAATGSASPVLIYSGVYRGMGTVVRDGYLYVADWPNQKVVQIDLSDNSASDYADIGGNCAGICFDDEGNLYATDHSNGQIHKITPEKTTSVICSGVDSPSEIEMAKDGSFYVRSLNSGYGIYHYNHDFSQLKEMVAEDLYGSWGGMTLNNNGTLFIGDTYQSRILTLETARQLTGTPLNEHVGDHPVVLRAVANGVTNEQAFTITVANSNDVPTIASTTPQTMAEDTSLTLTLDMIDAADVDVGDTLHLVVGAGENYTLEGTTLSPPANWHGTLSVPVYASDGMANSTAANLTVTVTNVVDPATVTLGNLAQTYNGSALSATATTDPAELMVEYTYNSSTTVPVSAGSYTVIGTINDEVYTGSSTGTLVIAKAELTVTAAARSKTYGTSDPELTYEVTGLVGEETLSGALTRADGEGVGSYTIEQGSLVANGNYALRYTGADLTITKAAVTATANAQGKVYGMADPELTYEVTGLVGEETLSGALTRTAGENVGTYAINQGTLAASDNYTFSFTGANLTISKAAVTATANAQGKVYGMADPELTYEVTGLVGEETLSGALTRTAGENVGTYAINKGTLAASDNYTFSFTGANLTINKAELTVTADAQSKVYGTSDPELTYEVIGLVGEETLSGALTRAEGEDVGSYAIAQGSVSASDNYTLSYTGADLTINKAELTVTANAQSKVYGTSDPELTYEVTGLVGEETLSGTLTRAEGEDVGSYAIAQGSVSASDNYTLSFTGANLTITKAALTVTAGAQSKIYGTPDPELTYEVTGLVGEESLTGALSRAEGENVGSYAIGQGSLEASANYMLSYTGADLIINKAAVTVTANAQSKVYGTSDSELTYEVIGLVGEETLSGKLTRADGEDVGSYVITQGTLSASDNYALSYINADLTIRPADQAIAFDGIGRQILTDVVNLVATADSGLPVHFRVVSGPASLWGETELSFNAAGHVLLLLTQEGNNNWNAAPAITNEFDVAGVITEVLPDNGTVFGGTEVVISGQWLGDGTDVTNVTLCGVAATVVSQDVHSVTISTGITNSPVEIVGDVMVESAGFGAITLTNAFTYRPVPLPPEALSAVDVTSDGFTARWTAAENTTHYYVDVAEDTNFVVMAAGFTNWNAGDSLRGVVTGLTSGVTYYYRVRSANEYGSSIDSNLIEVPVGDNTPYVQVEYTNSVVSAGSTDVIDLTEVFHGTGMEYTIETNSSPELIADSLEGSELVLVYADSAGSGFVRVSATDPENGFSVDVVFNITVELSPMLELGPMTLNWQNGLYEQVATVSNRSSRAAESVTLTVIGLSEGATLYNATGIDELDRPEIHWVGALDGYAAQSFIMQYHMTQAGIPVAEVEASLSLEEPEENASGSGVPARGQATYVSGEMQFLLEFDAVPGRLYYIQYTDSLMDEWRTVYPGLVAPISHMQWIDSGPPATARAPSESDQRFYRVIEATP